MVKNNKHVRIAILMGQNLGYCRQILTGIHTYGLGQPGWTIRDGTPDHDVLGAVQDWKPHGVIAHLYDSSFAKALSSLCVPVVNTTSALTENPFPLVEADHELVGQLAADHFLDSGFRNMGFFGSTRLYFSHDRKRGFTNRLKAFGLKVRSCHAEYFPGPSVDSNWKDLDRKVFNWLKRLSKPIAILAANDRLARELCYACRNLALSIPSDVAILGVDNDKLECHLAHPPLSSIAPPAQRIGYEAAEMLDHYLHGRHVAEPYCFMPPIRVVRRQSTDIIAVEDPELAKALAFIGSHASEAIGVDDVVRKTALSRRGLERRFRTRFQRSILTEIRRSHIERAKELLTKTDLSIELVAERSGFSSAARLSHVFGQFEDMCPRQFRKLDRVTE